MITFSYCKISSTFF